MGGKLACVKKERAVKEDKLTAAEKVTKKLEGELAEKEYKLSAAEMETKRLRAIPCKYYLKHNIVTTHLNAHNYYKTCFSFTR